MPSSMGFCWEEFFYHFGVPVKKWVEPDHNDLFGRNILKSCDYLLDGEPTEELVHGEEDAKDIHAARVERRVEGLRRLIERQIGVVEQ